MASSTISPIGLNHKESGLLKDVEMKFKHDIEQRPIATVCRSSFYPDKIDAMSEKSTDILVHSDLEQVSLIQAQARQAFNNNGHVDELQQSGRTRSAAKKANQAISSDGDTRAKTDTTDNQEKEARGVKRKKKNAGGNEDSDSESEDNREPQLGEAKVAEEFTCLCPKNVMTCIGILPSLPIINHLYDSDDSLSSANDDLNFTVLPAVNRNKDHGS